jgi:hypothetical protein
MYCLHLRLADELEDEGLENTLSALQASNVNAGDSDAYNCTRLHEQIDLHVLCRTRLQTGINRRGCVVKEVARRADVIKLFPTTACSV